MDIQDIVAVREWCIDRALEYVRHAGCAHCAEERIIEIAKKLEKYVTK